MSRSCRWTAALFAAAVLAGPWTVAAQQDLSGDPGFVDFSQQKLFDDGDVEIQISVKDPLIKLVAEATRESDPALADVLGQLKAVEVNVYKVTQARRDEVRGEIDRQARQLEKGGWTEAIAIRLRGATGHVFLRLVDEKPVGLAAMYLDDGQGDAVFVNIVGKIDAAQVGRLASKFKLDLLGEALRDAAPAPDG
jgi:hypothetical protein